MIVRGWAQTDVGNVRENNEDSYLLDLDNQLFIVADGVGGSPAGEVASQHLVMHMAEGAAELHELVKTADPVKDRDHRERVFGRLFGMINEANTNIFKLGKEINPISPSATTADVMLITDKAAFIAHVGDSRIYLLRGGQVFRITEDHTFAEQLRNENVDNPAMVERYRNVLTRSIGGRPQVDIDALFIDLKADDRILMCSDGLTDYLSGTEIRDLALKYNADELIERLIDEAKERGGADNITALIVEIESALEVRPDSGFDTMQQVDILGQIALFENLDLPELIRVLRAVYEVSFKAGQIIMRPGDDDHCLYIIADGKVALSHNGHTVMLQRGQHFGAIALVLDLPRRKSATAKTNVSLLAVPSGRFRELVLEDATLGNKLLWNLLATASKQIVSLEADEQTG